MPCPALSAGYFARYAALQQLLTQFLDATAGQEPQVSTLPFVFCNHPE